MCLVADATRRGRQNEFMWHVSDATRRGRQNDLNGVECRRIANKEVEKAGSTYVVKFA